MQNRQYGSLNMGSTENRVSNTLKSQFQGRASRTATYENLILQAEMKKLQSMKAGSNLKPEKDSIKAHGLLAPAQTFEGKILFVSKKNAGS